MRSSSTLLALALVALVLMAGCAGGSAKNEPLPSQPSSEIKATGSAIEGTSAIEGIVVDDQTMPLQGVSVAVRATTDGTTLEAATDEGGRFVVSNILGGTYQVFATKLGYTSASRSLPVLEGETATLTITLAPIVVNEIFYDVIGPYKGFVTCGFTQPGVTGVSSSSTRQCPDAAGDALGDAVNDFEFELLQDNMNAIMGELRWSPSAVGTSQKLSLFLMPEDGGGSNWYCTNGGFSPVTLVYTEDPEMDQCSGRGRSPDPKVPEMETPLVLTVYLPFDSINPAAIEKSSPPNVVFQQNYESIVTVFYGTQPDELYSAFADA